MPNERITQSLKLVSIATAHRFSDGFHYVLVPVLPLIMQELGLSILQTGMIVSAQGLAVFLMLMPVSIPDRVFLWECSAWAETSAAQ